MFHTKSCTTCGALSVRTYVTTLYDQQNIGDLHALFVVIQNHFQHNMANMGIIQIPPEVACLTMI